MSLEQELEGLAERAVAAATKELVPRFRSDLLRVETKTSGLDVVTDADRAAERAVVDVIAQARPHDGFLGEEGTSRPSTSGITWVVDPLDSTANFARGLPHWSVTVAARGPAGVLAGAVGAPTSDEVLTAAKGHGMNLNGVTAPPASPMATLEASLGLVGWDRSLSETSLLRVGQVITRSGKLRSPGSPALGLAWTALGRADFAYYEQGFHEWDIAAGLFMCEERGLRTRLERGAVTHRLLVAGIGIFNELEELIFGAD